MTNTPRRPIQLFRHPLSGHSHRAELFLSLLGLEAELVDVDLMAGEHKRDPFLRRNAFGQVPVLDDDGVVVADSNAILVYLARKHGGPSWLPADPAGEAAVQRWLSVAAGQVASGPAAARLVTVFGAKLDAENAIARSHALLCVLDEELGQRPFLTGTTPTIADLAMYTYVAHAPEGNVSLAEYANVRRWLSRIEALPGFVPMQPTAVGLAASAAREARA